MALTEIVKFLNDRAEFEKAAVVLMLVAEGFLPAYVDVVRKLGFVCDREFRITQEMAEPGHQLSLPMDYAFYLDLNLYDRFIDSTFYKS